MPHIGKLRHWNDARGFGFIEPTGGGPEVFVHIGAFVQSGVRPVDGEVLSYRLVRGPGGEPQAEQVLRLAMAQPGPRRIAPPRPRAPRWPVWALLATVVVAMAAVQLQALWPPGPAAPALAGGPETLMREPPAAGPGYRCDGRLHCSQMKSCAEARFFLAYCPSVQLDSDADGEPCEQQWCTATPAR